MGDLQFSLDPGELQVMASTRLSCNSNSNCGTNGDLSKSKRIGLIFKCLDTSNQSEGKYIYIDSQIINRDATR